jgi:hypothetical protein
MRRFVWLPLLAACSQPVNPPPLRHLERPADVAFGCLVSATVEGVTATRALPPASCHGGFLLDPNDPTVDRNHPLFGQRGQLAAFILEPVRGDVAVVSDPYGATFEDSDGLSPGQNGLPVGRLPTGITTSEDGCYAVVANGGSCDLSLIHVVNAAQAREASVTRKELSSAAGPLRARPTMVVTRAAPATPPVLGTCAAEGQGQAYVAFEGCHLVARVDLATGGILDGVQTLPGQAPAIVGPDVTCPAECTPAPAPAKPQEADAGVEGPADAGPPPAIPLRPSALALEPDGSRLYAGAAGQGAMLIVDLDAGGAPTAARQVALEGAPGVTRLAATGPIAMGNEGGSTFHFVYAIGAESAIHVIDVTPARAPRECDTQIDRRYLRSFTAVERLACFAVGDPQNPPRRADADGPGIRLPRGVYPLDIAFLRGNAPLMPTETMPMPLPTAAQLNGLFALVSATGPVPDVRQGRGLLYVINVDDDNYPDLEGQFAGDDIALAIPHALRDANAGRATDIDTCDDPAPASSNAGAIRLSSQPFRQLGFVYADAAGPGAFFAPGLRRVLCDPTHATYELSTTAPADVRETLFPDLERSGVRAVSGGSPGDERIRVEWEGPLTFDQNLSIMRAGQVTGLDSSSLALGASGALLCSLGVEDGDIFALVGCNGNPECAPGEVCIEHPDTPEGVNGLCVPDRDVAEVTAACRQILVSQRRYTMLDVHQDRALLVTRPAALAASPIEGCTSNEQCTRIEDAVLRRAEEDDPNTPEGSLPRLGEFACEQDQARGGVPLCIPICATDADCAAGSVCAGERCVLGPVPPARCLAALQRYEVRSGDSFVVTSSGESFRHRQIVDPASGRCVEDPTLHRLFASRIRRIEPECTDLTVIGEGPNPCRIPNLTEPYSTGGPQGLRPAYGMRLRSPGVTFDLTDVGFPLTAVDNVLVSTIPSGFAFELRIAGGFAPYSFVLEAAMPARVKAGPDAFVWVVDSGDLRGGLVQGQVIFVTQNGVLNLVRLE